MRYRFKSRRLGKVTKSEYNIHMALAMKSLRNNVIVGDVPIEDQLRIVKLNKNGLNFIEFPDPQAVALHEMLYTI